MIEPKRSIKWLEKSEVEAIIASIKPVGLRNLRDIAMIKVLWETGLRISECLNLPDAPFIKENTNMIELSIIGKGNHRGTVYFGRECLKAIKSYLAVRNDSRTELFPITVRRAQQIITWRADRAGFTGISPHTLRHSFGTYIISQGENLRVAQELLRHRSITSTQIYTHITSPELKLAHKRLFK